MPAGFLVTQATAINSQQLAALREAILGPRISGVAVAADFPETEFVFGAKFDRADEFGLSRQRVSGQLKRGLAPPPQIM